MPEKMPDGYLYENMDDLYKQAEELQGYNALALRAMALWAHKNRKDKDAMRVASFVWGRNARLMARAVDRFGEWFVKDGVSTDDFLSLFALAQLPKKSVDKVYSDWRNYGLPAYAVREAVAAAKPQRERKESPIKQVGDVIRRAVSFARSNKSDHLGDGIEWFASELCAIPEIEKVVNSGDAND